MIRHMAKGRQNTLLTVLVILAMFGVVTAVPLNAQATGVKRTTMTRMASSSSYLRGGTETLRRGATVNSASRPHSSGNSCTYNGQMFNGSTGIPNVTPAETIALVCPGFQANQPLQVFEGSPTSTSLFAFDESPTLSNFFNDVDTSAIANVNANGSGTLSYTFTIPNPFTSNDLSASCPASQFLVNSGAPDCSLLVYDPSTSTSDPTAGELLTVGLSYTATPSVQSAGYWEVASDGGIFSFNAPFFG